MQKIFKFYEFSSGCKFTFKKTIGFFFLMNLFLAVSPLEVNFQVFEFFKTSKIHFFIVKNMDRYFSGLHKPTVGVTGHKWNNLEHEYLQGS